MNYLFIAEKPSLMKEVQSCYNNHKSEIINAVGKIDFIALSGHVCTLYGPDDYDRWKDLKWSEVEYPMIPSEWLIKPINDKYKRNTISKIRGMVKDYDGIIVGTDSDVEGYGIYYLLENYLNITNMKALRFIEHSLTDKEILESLLSMKDYHTDIIHKRFTDSFKLRAFGDWLFGMNCTRTVSEKAGDMMAIGRVKAPTIKLVYDNSLAISNFVPEDFLTIQMKYNVDGIEFVSVYCEDGITPVRFDENDTIPNVSTKGIVKEIEKKDKKVHAPALFDLTSIQGDAGKKYGYSPDMTLSILQALYETHKIISYPRTQCQYISSEKSKEFEDMLEKVKVFDDLRKYVEKINTTDIARVQKDKKVVNDAEVEKESHDALLPTSKKANLSELNEDEKNILHMIYTRLVAQFLPYYVEEQTRMVIMHEEKKFIAKGKTIKKEGWKELYKVGRDSVLPECKVEDVLIGEKNIAKGKTTPPKRLTQSSLVTAMSNIASSIKDKELKQSLAESKGIGTPATRSEIIKDIIKKGYIESKKDGLYITSLGKEYIGYIKDLDIVSAEFAAVMDHRIKKVQRGEAEYIEVYQYIINELNRCIQQIESGIKKKQKDLDVRCPKCKEKYTVSKFSYNCPSCDLKISKMICGVTIDEKKLEKLSDGETIGPFRCTKKDGNKFDASFKLGDEGIEFVFQNTIIKCPECNEDMKVNKGGAFCDCGFRVFRKCAGRLFSDKELEELIKYGSLEYVKGFKKKAGGTFDAGVEIDNEGNVNFIFS